MGIFSYFRTKKNTAEVAKNRLQIIVAHERAQNGGYEFCPACVRNSCRLCRNMCMWNLMTFGWT